jgi:hypothetical protein
MQLPSTAGHSIKSLFPCEIGVLHTGKKLSGNKLPASWQAIFNVIIIQAIAFFEKNGYLLYCFILNISLVFTAQRFDRVFYLFNQSTPLYSKTIPGEGCVFFSMNVFFSDGKKCMADRIKPLFILFYCFYLVMSKHTKDSAGM